jgi:hypothetical protein
MEIINKSLHVYDFILLFGDFNVDFNNRETNVNYSNNFKDFLSSCGLEQIVTENTFPFVNPIYI